MNGNVNMFKVGGEEKKECWDRRVLPARRSVFPEGEAVEKVKPSEKTEVGNR